MDARPAHWWGLQATDDDFTPGDLKRLGRPARASTTSATDDARGATVAHTPTASTSAPTSWRYASEVIADPEFRRRLDIGRRASRTRTRSSASTRSASPRYLTLAGYHARDLRRRRAALPPRLPGVGVRPAGRGLPAAQAAVPAREPLRRPRPRQLEGAGARPSSPAPTSTRSSATCCASRRRATCTAPSPSAPAPTARVAMPEPVEPDNFDDEDRWVPKHSTTGGRSPSIRSPIGSRATPARSSRRFATTRRSARSC